MKPIDFRNATFDTVQTYIAGQREAVLAAWRKHGPGTTAEVCARATMSILSFRPRTTELYQLGFVTLAEDQGTKGPRDQGTKEGTYRVRTDPELREWVRLQQHFARNPQRELPLQV